MSTTWQRLQTTRSPVLTLRAVAADVRRWSTRAHSPKPGTYLIDYVAADIVNNCNLRCPFCLVDYSQTRHTDLMSEETFRAMLRLAPEVPEAGFWLSCLHEPTLHPKLGPFIDMIPAEQRGKFWFTTNLARKLPDPLIATLASSGLHHINVSLDTFDDALFAILRKHGRVSVFRDNLERLVAACRASANAPRMRYITMAFRSNLREIPRLVRWMNESGLASDIEIRYTFNTSNIPEDFKREQYLGPPEWDELRASLDALPYSNYILSTPPDGYAETEAYMPANWFDLRSVGFSRAAALQPPLQLRARPDGRLHLVGHEDVVALDVREHEDPLASLKQLCAAPVAIEKSA